MIIETAITVAKEVAKEAGKVAIESAKMCAEQLPEKIGELTEAESLPEKIELIPREELPVELPKDMPIPDFEPFPGIPDDGKKIPHPKPLEPVERPKADNLELDKINTEKKSDVSKQADTDKTTDAPTEKKGGSYKDVKVEGEGDKYEVHHMPSDSSSNLERNDGPAIKMEKADHRQTASCGMSAEAREYREMQKQLISEGKFREAMQMDIDDIHEKFGNKYDDAISEMLEYVDKLEGEGKI